MDEVNELFYMQRYLGSKEEFSDESRNDVETKVSPESNTSLSSTNPKRKLSRTLSENIDESENFSFENEAFNPSQGSAKKKVNRKKEKVSSNKTASENLRNKHDDEKSFCVIGQVKELQSVKIKPILPKWLSKPTFIEISLSDKEIPVSELVYLDYVTKQNLKNAKIDLLFPVQLAVIPWLIQSNQQCMFIRPSDLCVSAPTGSGKTLAFVLPIIQSLKNRVVTTIRALVVLPVAELASQVYKVFETFVKDTDLKVVLLTGKKSFKSEQSMLLRQGASQVLGLADIVVTTPGRVLDHVNRTEGFCLQQLRYLVIDEADRIMEDIQQGWLKQIEDSVYKNCHSSSCVCFSVGYKHTSVDPSTACQFGHVSPPFQKLLYSATLSHDPESLHALSLYRPKLFTAQAKSKEWIGKCSIPENLSQLFVVCKSEVKPLTLYHFVQRKKFSKILCFVESVERAQRLHLVLEEMGGLAVRELSSNLSPIQRKIILEQFVSGKIDLLVCSDLVARGMDLEDVDCVISYDVPLFIKKYVHRIGRTARAGKMGTAVTIMAEEQVSPFKKMLTSAGMPPPEQLSINLEDLEIDIDKFKNALNAADAKFKKLKAAEGTQFKEKTSSKKKNSFKNSQKSR